MDEDGHVDHDDNDDDEDRKVMEWMRACAVETHMDIWEGPFCVEICKKKCRTLIPQHTFCASLRGRNAHGHFTRAILMEIYREIAARTTSIKHRASTLTARTPSVWRALFAEKQCFRHTCASALTPQKCGPGGGWTEPPPSPNGGIEPHHHPIATWYMTLENVHDQKPLSLPIRPCLHPLSPLCPPPRTP